MITLLLMQCSGTLWLRFLSIFGGVLRENIGTRASFNATLTNYISEESLKNEAYDKIQLKRGFILGKVQEPVRRETAEQSYSQGINQQKCVRLFGYSDWLSKYTHLKLQQIKICEICYVNGRHEKNMLNIKISRSMFVFHFQWNILTKFHENPSILHTL